jgi:hypothetical protein
MPRQMADGLQDDTQRALFDRVSGPTVSAALGQAQQHAERQLAQYETDASHARAAAASDFAINAWNPAPGADNTPYRQALITQKIELEKQADKLGLADPALREHYLQFGPDGQSGIAATYTGIVTGLLNNDQPQAARQYYDQVQDHLPVAMRDKLAGYLEHASDKQQAYTAALHAQAQSPDAVRQQQILDTLKNDGKISPGAHAIARQTLQAQRAAIQSRQTDNDKQALGRVWNLKNANPNAALTDLNAADYAYLKSRGLDTQAQAILNGHPAQDDPGLFNDLHRLSAQDPVQFGKENLLAHSGSLSRAHLATLQGVQDAINKQELRQIAANAAAHNAINIVLRDLRTKITPSGRQAKKQE